MEARKRLRQLLTKSLCWRADAVKTAGKGNTKMKKSLLKHAAVALAAMAMTASCALADGGSGWLYSGNHGSVQFASYAGWYDGYVDVDGYGGDQANDSLWVTVISKRASVWSSPSTGSKRLGWIDYGNGLHVVTNDSGEPVMEKNFYKVEYNGKQGWIGAPYVVRNKLEIVLMESNVPAYIAPDTSSKKVGSVDKMTRYRVIGFYDDFYIVSFRGAACAYIPMNCRHYDTTFESVERYSSYGKGTIDYNTKLRTGPGENYPEIKEMKSGEKIICIDEIAGWYVIQYSGKNADGNILAFVDSDAVTMDDGNING